MLVGLVSDGGYALSLKKTVFNATFLGGFGVCTLTNMYSNDSSVSINTRYICSLPPEGQVTGFTAVAGRKVITSSLLSRENVPVVPEPTAPYFEARVGKIMAGVSVRTEVKYICSFPEQNGKKRIAIPLALPSRPYEQVNFDDLGGASFVLEGEVQYYGYEKIVNITSPTHKIKCIINDNLAQIKIFGGSPQSFELVLEIEEAPLQEPYVLTADGVAAYSFLPDFSGATQRPKEYLFVLDLTSLSPRRLEQAKNALSVCVRTLRKGERFNIYAVGDGLFSKNAQPADDIAFEQMEKWMLPLKHRAGEECTVAEAMGRRYHAVVILSDGRFADKDNLQKIINGSTRLPVIYAIGASDAANRKALYMLAVQSGGRYYIPRHRERLDEAVIRIFRDVVSPSIDNAVVIADNSFGSVYPKNIRCVHAGEHVEAVARIRGDTPGELIFRGEVGGVVSNWKIPFKVCDAPQEALELLLHKRIMDIELINISMGEDRLGKRRKEVALLSLESGIPSDGTVMLLTYRSGSAAFSEINPLCETAVWAKTWLPADENDDFEIKFYIDLIKTQRYDGSFVSGKDAVASTSDAIIEICRSYRHPEQFMHQLLKGVRFLLESVENNEKSAQIRSDVLDALNNWYEKFHKYYPINDEISQKVLALLYLHRSK